MLYSLCRMTHCVEWLIEAGEALAPGGGVCGGVVGVAPKQLDTQDHEDEDEQEQQQHEIPQCHHTLHGCSTRIGSHGSQTKLRPKDRQILDATYQQLCRRRRTVQTALRGDFAWVAKQTTQKSFYRTLLYRHSVDAQSHGCEDCSHHANQPKLP